MARTTSPTKRLMISKANAVIVISTAAASFVLVFTLVAGKSLSSQAAYQNRVINLKEKALTQLKNDLEARDSLARSYKAFLAEDPNLLAGDPAGTGPKDGDNVRLILDALPSKYNYPALLASVEKIVLDQNLTILSISGTDQEVDQGSQQSSPEPQPIAMPFQVRVSGSYTSIQSLIAVFSHSIRPFQIKSIELTGDETSMIATITAQTFYQPEKSLKIKDEVVE